MRIKLLKFTCNNGLWSVDTDQLGGYQIWQDKFGYRCRHFWGQGYDLTLARNRTLEECLKIAQVFYENEVKEHLEVDSQSEPITCPHCHTLAVDVQYVCKNCHITGDTNDDRYISQSPRTDHSRDLVP